MNANLKEHPIRVDIVSDVVCPWCIIGYRQLVEAADNLNIAIDVHWHPFELNRDMPKIGENVKEHIARKYGTNPENLGRARNHIGEVAARHGITFNFSDEKRIYNTFLAHQLIDWASEQGKGNETNLAIMTAYFTDNKDISDSEVLVNIASDVGLDAEAARTMLQNGERAEGVRAQQEFWLGNRIQSVPTIIFEREHLVSGAQGVENYQEHLKKVSSQSSVSNEVG